VVDISGRRVVVGSILRPGWFREVVQAEVDAGEDGGRHRSASALGDADRDRATDGHLNFS
jgi:hypothetical protein